MVRTAYGFREFKDILVRAVSLRYVTLFTPFL